MSPIKFYYMPESPPCRAVEMVATILGIEFDKQYVDLFVKDNLKEDYIKVNPLHKIPFIVDDGMGLGESRAIMAYLVNQYGSEHQYLYPKEPKQRAQVDSYLYFDLGILYQTGSTLLKPLLFGAKELDAEHEKLFKEALQFLEQRLEQIGPNKFIAGGDKITLADISIVATLSFPISCGYDFKDYKHILAYVERLKSSIPKYHEINDEPAENLRKFAESRKASSK